MIHMTHPLRLGTGFFTSYYNGLQKIVRILRVKWDRHNWGNLCQLLTAPPVLRIVNIRVSRIDLGTDQRHKHVNDRVAL